MVDHEEAFVSSFEQEASKVVVKVWPTLLVVALFIGLAGKYFIVDGKYRYILVSLNPEI